MEPRFLALQKQHAKYKQFVNINHSKGSLDDYLARKFKMHFAQGVAIQFVAILQLYLQPVHCG